MDGLLAGLRLLETKPPCPPSKPLIQWLNLPLPLYDSSRYFEWNNESFILRKCIELYRIEVFTSPSIETTYLHKQKKGRNILYSYDKTKNCRNNIKSDNTPPHKDFSKLCVVGMQGIQTNPSSRFSLIKCLSTSSVQFNHNGWDWCNVYGNFVITIPQDMLPNFNCKICQNAFDPQQFTNCMSHSSELCFCM